MKSLYFFTLVVITFCAQWIIPYKMISNKESLLKKGTAFKFKTQPIDPTDPIRGKYINLHFEANQFKTTDSTWLQNQTIYVYFKNDSLGFAKIKKIKKTVEGKSKNFIKTKVKYYTKYNKTLHINLPFNRFYMEESKAKPAELAYNKHTKNSIYAIVHIENGAAVLKDVYINETPISKFIEKK